MPMDTARGDSVREPAERQTQTIRRQRPAGLAVQAAEVECQYYKASDGKATATQYNSTADECALSVQSAEVTRLLLVWQSCLLQAEVTATSRRPGPTTAEQRNATMCRHVACGITNDVNALRLARRLPRRRTGSCRRRSSQQSGARSAHARAVTMLLRLVLRMRMR